MGRGPTFCCHQSRRFCLSNSAAVQLHYQFNGRRNIDQIGQPAFELMPNPVIQQVLVPVGAGRGRPHYRPAHRPSPAYFVDGRAIGSMDHSTIGSTDRPTDRPTMPQQKSRSNVSTGPQIQSSGGGGNKWAAAGAASVTVPKGGGGSGGRCCIS